MPNYANENSFDEKLKQIGDLYEEGKDCLSNLPIHEFGSGEMASHSRLYTILENLRTIAAVNLRATHEIKDN